MCGKYENINYMIVTFDLVNNSILGLHLGRGMVSSVRMVSLVRMVKLGHSCTNVTRGKLYGSLFSDHVNVHLGLNLSSSTHNCGGVVDGGNAMAAI